VQAKGEGKKGRGEALLGKKETRFQAGASEKIQQRLQPKEKGGGEKNFFIKNEEGGDLHPPVFDLRGKTSRGYNGKKRKGINLLINGKKRGEGGTVLGRGALPYRRTWVNRKKGRRRKTLLAPPTTKKKKKERRAADIRHSSEKPMEEGKKKRKLLLLRRKKGKRE